MREKISRWIPMERKEKHQQYPISPSHFCFEYYKYILQPRCLEALDIDHMFIINTDKHSATKATSLVWRRKTSSHLHTKIPKTADASSASSTRYPTRHFWRPLTLSVSSISMRCSWELVKLVYTLYASRPFAHSMPYTFGRGCPQNSSYRFERHHKVTIYSVDLRESCWRCIRSELRLMTLADLVESRWSLDVWRKHGKI